MTEQTCKPLSAREDLFFDFDMEEANECWKCGGEGYDGHDCGEDACACADPEENMLCDICEGTGYI